MNIRHEKVYEQLAAIAPTVMIDDDISYVNWRGRFKQLGQWFDKEAAVEKWLADYDAKAAELAATAKSLFDRIKSGSPIGLWGGIFQNSELYREIFTQKLGEDYKDRVKLLDFTPEIGAVIAALRENSVYINEIMLSNIKNTYRKATL